MAYIDKVPLDKASGRLRKIYDDAIARAGRVFQILQVQSQNPRTLAASMGLYQATVHAESPLSRAEREMIAVVVSHTNDCFY